MIRTDIRCNPLRYVPNEAINIVAAVLYFIVAIILTICESATKSSLTSRELQEKGELVYGLGHRSMV